VNTSGKRSKRTDAYNAARSRVRARVEHVFHVVKRLWGFTKARYRGLAKNTARAFAAFALANLYLVRKRLTPCGTQCARERRVRGETPPCGAAPRERTTIRR
jgi:Transposase DDE domain